MSILKSKQVQLTTRPAGTLANDLKSGKILLRETVVEGIDNGPAAFIELLAGGNIGKMIVKV